MRRLYTFLLYLITPLVLLRLFWRGFELRAYWQRIPERFGWVRPSRNGIAVWVHAVSVGESLAAMPLIKALVKKHGRRNVWVTTTTPTGSARVVEALGDSVRHSYAPYDLPGAVARFINALRPHQVVVMETELWPNLFHDLQRRKIPLIIANARLSPNSFKGYSRVSGFAAATLAACTAVAAQSDADAERFRALGAPRVSVMGNIKFDMPVPAEMLARGRALRAECGASRAVWIAASTHEGEDALALRVHQRILERFPEALLILVPRHPQRFDHVARLIENRDLRFARRSSGGELRTAQVLLGDSMGEMLLYFAASDVALVAGSFVPVGGHNILEPAALGLPVLFGPQMFNFMHARDLLLGVGAASQVADEAGLREALLALLMSPARRETMGAAGRQAVAANRGALDRLLLLLAP